MPSEDPTPPTGETPARIGRYRILREAGRGGMGCVYQAVDDSLRRTVAIKIVHAAGVQVRERFLREARTAASLVHPGLVRVQEVGEDSGKPFLVMDWIEGCDLRTALEEGRLSLREAVEALAQAAEAVAFAHTRGVVHRDLKPENILVTPDRTAVVTDFGLAIDLGSDEMPLSMSGTPIGTPGYMSPEQVRGRRAEIDARTDVWGLAATLYSLLTGTAPFRGLTLADVFLKILESDPAPPRKLRRDSPVDLETICLKGLSKERDARYASAREFAADLRRWLGGDLIVARRSGPARRAKRWIRAHRASVGIAMGILLLLPLTAYGANHLQKTRSYRLARDQAKNAHAAGDWTRALVEGERALTLREDAGIRAIVEESRRRLETRRNHQELLARIAAIDLRIRDLRFVYYIKAADPPDKLSEIHAGLAELEAWVGSARFSGFPEGWRCLGAAWFHLGDLRRAETALLKAESLHARDAEVCFLLGRIYLERSMVEMLPDESGIHASRRRRADDWTRRAIARLTVDLAALAPLHRHLAETFLRLAEGRNDDVVRRCEEGVALYGREIGAEEYWLLRAWAVPSMESLTRAIEIRPHYPWALLLRGVLRPASESEAAIADCTEAARLHPRFAAAFVGRAHLRYHRREYRTALEDFTAALSLEPGLAHALVDRSACRMRMGDAAGALADAEEAVRADPGSPDAHFARGVAHDGLKEWSTAVADYTRCLDLDPLRSDVYVNRGIALLRGGDRKAALADFDVAIRMQPANGLAWYNRGYVRSLEGDAEGAVADYTEALRHDPGHAQAWNNRGLLRWKKHDLNGAASDFTEAILRDSTLAESYINRGDVRIRLGDRAGAAEDLRRGLTLLPADHPARARIEKSLQGLNP